jgi:hypothetical protein
MKITYVLYPDYTALDLVDLNDVISRWPDAEVAGEHHCLRCICRVFAVDLPGRSLPK